MLFLSYVVWLRSKRLGMNNYVSRFFFSILTTYNILIKIYIWIFFYFIQILYPSKHPQQTASNTVSLNCISTYERHRTSYEKTNCTHDKINCTVFLIDYRVHLTVRILEPRPSNFPLKSIYFTLYKSPWLMKAHCYWKIRKAVFSTNSSCCIY